MYILLLSVVITGIICIHWLNGDLELLIKWLTTGRRPKPQQSELPELKQQLSVNSRTLSAQADQIDGLKDELHRVENLCNQLSSQIRMIQQSVQNFQQMSYTKQQTNNKGNSSNTHGANTSSNSSFAIGKKFYATSPSGLNPVKFALSDISEKPGKHYYCINVVGNNSARLELVNDKEVLKSFVSSLQYQSRCVEILDKPSATPRKISVVSPGTLEFHGNDWILTKRIQIKIL